MIWFLIHLLMLVGLGGDGIDSHKSNVRRGVMVPPKPPIYRRVAGGQY